MVVRIAEDRETDLKRWEPEEAVQGAIVFIGSVSSRGNKGQVLRHREGRLGGHRGDADEGSDVLRRACGIIHPGFTDTPIPRSLGEEFLQKHVLPFTQLRRLIRREIADAICFMISNSAVSGELWADAGWRSRHDARVGVRRSDRRHSI